MSERAKIILIYSLVAAVSGAVVGTSMWIRHERRTRFDHRAFAEVGKEIPADLGRLETDLVATNQAGEEVRLSALKDKVWIATCFFASCPKCLVTSAQDLTRLYAEFRDEPDFHIVSITVNPDEDTTGRLQAYATALGADPSNWWFLRAPREETYRYVEQEMKFLKVTENTGTGATERFSHDRGLQVFGRGWVRVGKRDLHYARTEGEARHAAWFEELRHGIHTALDNEDVASADQDP